MLLCRRAGSIRERANDGNQDEATLDVDRVMGTAPGVGVDLVVSADSRTVSGIYTAAAYEVNTLVDPVMSISFGDCEANAGQQGVSVWDTLFSAAAAEGISVMVSSGDSGAAGCDGDSFDAAGDAECEHQLHLCK